MSFDTLQKKIWDLANPTVAGLDPRPEHVPPAILEKHLAAKGNTLAAAADAFYEFNCGLIDAFCDLVPAVKPQSAYYELLGWEGVQGQGPVRHRRCQAQRHRHHRHRLQRGLSGHRYRWRRGAGSL